jgi:hypothetical protein
MENYWKQINESESEQNRYFNSTDEIEVLKLTKNGKSPREYSISSELHMYAPEEFKIR